MRVLTRRAAHLITDIGLKSGFGSPGLFGPMWRGHPFNFTTVSYTAIPETALTRWIAESMGPRQGDRGRLRAITFLKVVGNLHLRRTGFPPPYLATLDHGVSPKVTAEYRVHENRGANSPRVDLVFEWISQNAGPAAVLIETKLGAALQPKQLANYRSLGQRLTKGGEPPGLYLLNVRPDKAERRYPAWMAVRWWDLMRQWEMEIRGSEDHDPHFSMIRGNVWSYLLRQMEPKNA